LADQAYSAYSKPRKAAPKRWQLDDALFKCRQSWGAIMLHSKLRAAEKAENTPVFAAGKALAIAVLRDEAERVNYEPKNGNRSPLAHHISDV
jgi:hypothetical protein